MLTMCQNGLFLNVVPESTRILSWSECHWQGRGAAAVTCHRRKGGGVRGRRVLLAEAVGPEASVSSKHF